MSTEHPTRAGPSKRLTVLSQAERLALYGLPDFDAFQRAEYFALTGPERALAERRRGSAAQLHCMLQIGYFKAKRAFFSLSAPTMPAEDVAFLVERYFPADPVTFRPVTPYEQYSQRTEIAKLFGYRLWSAMDLPALIEAAASLARRDVTPVFVLIELLAFLSAGKIIRPGYTTLQSIIGDALAAERQRLERPIEVGLDTAPRAALRNLLARDDTLSELAALKQDGEHQDLWGFQAAAADVSVVLSLASPGCQRSNIDRSVPSSVRVRVAAAGGHRVWSIASADAWRSAC